METPNLPKSQLMLVLVLLVFVLISILSLAKQQSYKVTSPNTSQAQEFFELSALLADSPTDLALLMGTKNLKPLMRNLPQSNDKPNYYSQLSDPIVINSGFKILLNFTEHNTNSQLIISGRENLQNNRWWENIYQLRLGYSKENKGLVISLLNGQKPNSIYYQIFKEIKKNQSFVLQFNDEFGSSFSLLDLTGNTLTTVNLLEKKYQMPAGLFPYQSLQVGVNLTPKIGKLTINKFYLYEFR